MKKISFFLAALVFIAFGGCDKMHDDEHAHGIGTNPGSYITNVHAPTSGSDSITFTADSSQLSLVLFCPLGGTNMVAIRNLTTGSFLFHDTISQQDRNIMGFIPGQNYSVMCYSGTGSPTTFGHVSSSYRNSGQMPSPFTGYTQYYNTAGMQGPNDGAVIFVLDEPASGSKIAK